ncbi:hypothetical protein RHSIM_Rhsim13G0010200 [Rhododendron simsii]|uniref:NAD-dependent epimerase/dehydratase domain-containing protein n=1 Tax=Rhododendron simsii TaxID=118357 RepID=A0A834L7U7_RHOSS|nr:hypothetical protein RHSIM_Rhsim13G0010200 [Rhododendron simsii]
MGAELIYRGHETQPTSASYTPKPHKPWIHPIRYILREQRLLFVLIGIAIATVFFSLLPASSPNNPHHGGRLIHNNPFSDSHFPAESTQLTHHHRVFYQDHFHAGGKVPLGLKTKGLRIVVTGGAGFVGSHLVDRLIARGDSVIVVDNFFTGQKENVMHHFRNPRFELIRHDVVEPLLLEVDQIYHLACPASPVHYKFNPVKTIISFLKITNVVGTLNMLGLAKRVGARFLLTSTSVRSCYDEGKRTAETLTMDYHRGAGVEARIARIFNTYGPRMCIDDGRVVSNFVAQALRKEPLTVYGDGQQTRSFQYVSDLVEGLMRLMEGEHVGPFNLGNPGEFTMIELAQVVQETIDPNAKIEFKPNTEDDPHKRKPDITKAKDLLGWEPKVSLRQGLPLMVSDFRQRIFGDQKEGSATTATTTTTKTSSG